MAIDLESTMDKALAVRVDAALTNHRWAQMAQPLYFNETAAALEQAQASLAAAEAKQQESLSLARSHGWL
jgi:hypothetical protein